MWAVEGRLEAVWRPEYAVPLPLTGLEGRSMVWLGDIERDGERVEFAAQMSGFSFIIYAIGRGCAVPVTRSAVVRPLGRSIRVVRRWWRRNADPDCPLKIWRVLVDTWWVLKTIASKGMYMVLDYDSAVKAVDFALARGVHEVRLCRRRRIVIAHNDRAVAIERIEKTLDIHPPDPVVLRVDTKRNVGCGGMSRVIEYWRELGGAGLIGLVETELEVLLDDWE